MANQLKKIVCPVDFSELSENALAQAAEIAKQNGAELLLITVVQPISSAMFGDGTLFTTDLSPLPVVPTEVMQEHLAKLRDKYCAMILERTSIKMVMGIAFVEIVLFAREVGADLIVMGSHGRTGIKHLLIGSVAERVVRKAPCSVLVVRDLKRNFVMP